MTISFEIEGVPVTGKAARTFAVTNRGELAHKGDTVSHYRTVPDKRVRSFKQRVAALALIARQKAGCKCWPRDVGIEANIFIRCKRPLSTPDLDNAQKILWDACKGIIFKDDAQIVNLHAEKTQVHTKGMREGTSVVFRKMS